MISDTGPVKIVMAAIYAARLNPKIKMINVYRDIAKELNCDFDEILNIVQRHEGMGYLVCSGKQTLFTPVLTENGKIYVENLNIKSLIM